MTPLEDLEVSGKEFDRELLTMLLKPYLRLDKETCSIRPIEGWASCSNEIKVVLYLLARKAMVALGYPIEREEAAPKEIIPEIGIKAGSAHPTLRELLGRGMLAQRGTKYFVPNHALPRIKSMLEQQKEEKR